MKLMRCIVLREPNVKFVLALRQSAILEGDSKIILGF